jgi:hypothetical protein
MKQYAIIDHEIEIAANFVRIGTIGNSSLYLLAGTKEALDELKGSQVIKIKANARQLNRINKFLDDNTPYCIPGDLSDEELEDALIFIFAPGTGRSDFDVLDPEAK